MGSVATSAVPVRDQTCWISWGNSRRSIFSICVEYRSDSSSETLASRTVLTTTLCSPSRACILTGQYAHTNGLKFSVDFRSVYATLLSGLFGADDTEILVGALRRLRDRGNTLIVVEHDPIAIREADHVVELGPASGERGGRVVFQLMAAGRQTRKKYSGRKVMGPSKQKRDQLYLSRARPMQEEHIQEAIEASHNAFHSENPDPQWHSVPRYPNGEQAMDIMQKLNEEIGAAFIFATHDPRVMSYARRVVKMRDGRLVDNGSENNDSDL